MLNTRTSTSIINFKSDVILFIYMSLRNVIPDEIPSQIKNYDDIILYALGAIGPLERDLFINHPENDITDRMNKNTFHKWAKELRRMNFIEVEPAGKNKIYKITPNGENELLRRLKKYQLDFESVNKIEQNRIKKYVKDITNFFNRFNIIDDEVKVEFLELANEITIDKINIFSEEKINKSILFLALNHPKFYLLYDISAEAFIKEINKSSEENLTLTDLKMFLQLVIEEDIFNLNFYKITIQREKKDLYFKANSHYGVIFETVIKKKLRNINYLKNLKNVEISIRELINEVVDLLISDYQLFDILLKDDINILVRNYIRKFKETITSRARFGLTDYKQYFSIFEELQSSLSALTRRSSYQKHQLTIYEEYPDVFIEKPWFSILNKELLRELIQTNDEYSKEVQNLVETIKNPKNFTQLQSIIKELIPSIKRPELVYILVDAYIFVFKQYDKALDLLDKYKNLKIISEEDFRYFYLKAWLSNLLKKNEQALNFINKAINLNPEEIKLKYSKFLILKSTQNFGDALIVIEEMIKINPNIINLVEKSLILMNLKRYDESLQTIDEAIMGQPNNELLYIIKIQEIFKEIKNENEIITEYNKLLKKFPEKVLVYRYFSLFLKKIMKYEEALIQINKTLELKPESIELAQIKIELLNFLQKDDELINFVKSKSSIEIFNYTIEILTNDSKYDKALLITNEALNRLPKPQSFPWNSFIEECGFYDSYRPKSFEKIETYYFSLNEEAQTSFSYSLKFLMLKSRKFYLLANLNIEDYITEMKSFLDNEKDYPFYKDLKMEYFKMTNEYDKLFDYIDDLISQNVKFDSRYLNSIAYSLIGDYKKDLAIKAIQKAIQLDPKSGNYYDSYGEILLLSGDYKEGIKQFEMAIKINPKDYFIHESYIKMGNCYLKMKKPDLALDFLNKGKLIAEERKNERWVRKANMLIKEAKKDIKRSQIINST